MHGSPVVVQSGGGGGLGVVLELVGAGLIGLVGTTGVTLGVGVGLVELGVGVGVLLATGGATTGTTARAAEE